MGPIHLKILTTIGIILICINGLLPSCSGSKITRSSVKSLAKQTGSTQYSIDNVDSIDHSIQKRLIEHTFNDDGDNDYEVYQGVVGRPGIDFPVLTRIPPTKFDCRKYGNGYFADVETDCQVFHICDTGKKSSFLCPNGTIFQQSDVTCDWWFKVTCDASPGHYEESADMLSKAQSRYAQRIQQDLNLSDPLDKLTEIQRKMDNIQYTPQKTERKRISNRKFHSRNEYYDEVMNDNDNYDFEDVSTNPITQKNSLRSKSLRNQQKSGTNRDDINRDVKDLTKSINGNVVGITTNRHGGATESLETQEFAESGSFVLNSRNNLENYQDSNKQHLKDVTTSTKSNPDNYTVKPIVQQIDVTNKKNDDTATITRRRPNFRQYSNDNNNNVNNAYDYTKYNNLNIQNEGTFPGTIDIKLKSTASTISGAGRQRTNSPESRNTQKFDSTKTFETNNFPNIESINNFDNFNKNLNNVQLSTTSAVPIVTGNVRRQGTSRNVKNPGNDYTQPRKPNKKFDVSILDLENTGTTATGFSLSSSSPPSSSPTTSRNSLGTTKTPFIIKDYSNIETQNNDPEYEKLLLNARQNFENFQKIYTNDKFNKNNNNNIVSSTPVTEVNRGFNVQNERRQQARNQNRRTDFNAVDNFNTPKPSISFSLSSIGAPSTTTTTTTTTPSPTTSKSTVVISSTPFDKSVSPGLSTYSYGNDFEPFNVNIKNNLNNFENPKSGEFLKLQEHNAPQFNPIANEHPQNKYENINQYIKNKVNNLSSKQETDRIFATDTSKIVTPNTNNNIQQLPPQQFQLNGSQHSKQQGTTRYFNNLFSGFQFDQQPEEQYQSDAPRIHYEPPPVPASASPSSLSASTSAAADFTGTKSAAAQEVNKQNSRNNSSLNKKYNTDQPKVLERRQDTTRNFKNNFSGYEYTEPERTSRDFDRRTETNIEQDLDAINRKTTTTKSITTYDNTPPSRTTILSINPTTFSSPHRGTPQSRNVQNVQKQEQSRKPYFYTTPNTIFNVEDDFVKKPFGKFNTFSQYQEPSTTDNNIKTYYTPTIPTIINRKSFDVDDETTTTATTSDQQTTTISSTILSQHAIEMMNTLKELSLGKPLTVDDLEKMINNNINDDMPSDRSGLIIPPSSSPDTLHSLALYFATAVDNFIMTNNTDSELTTTNVPLDVDIANDTDISSVILSNNTLENFQKLFAIDSQDTTATMTEEEVTKIIQANVDAVQSRFAAAAGIGDDKRKPKSDSASLDEQNNSGTDLITPNTLNVALDNAAGSPQIRELAQVFTHALSAYLHDPSKFRRILAEIRPTEPPSISGSSSGTTDPISSETAQKLNDILTNRIGRNEGIEKEVDLGITFPTRATYLPTSPPCSEDLHEASSGGIGRKPATVEATIATTTTEDLEVLDFSDVTISPIHKQSLKNVYPETTPVSIVDDTLTNRLSVKQREQHNNTLKINVDRTPGSRFLTQPKSFNLDNNSLESTTTIEPDTDKPLLAPVEINNALSLSTLLPYFSDEHIESSSVIDDSSNDDDGTNYFPASENFGKRINLNDDKPYGHNVKPSDSTPITGDLSTLTTNEAADIGTSTITSTDNSFITTTNQPNHPSISFELLPPNSKLKHPVNLDDNDLQRAQSQSIFGGNNVRENSLNQRGGKKFTLSSTNKLNSIDNGKDQAYRTTTVTPSTQRRGHFITQTIPPFETTTFNDQQQFTTTESNRYNPLSTLSYSLFLDALTINDGLMNNINDETFTSTVLPQTSTVRDSSTISITSRSKFFNTNTYLPTAKTESTAYETTTLQGTTESGRLNLRFNDQDNNNGLAFGDRIGKVLKTTTEPNVFKDIMQDKANEIFGSLNDTQADQLLHVMKNVDKNRNAKRLILLLIQTCDDDHDKTVEETRKALLKALINMDNDLTDDDREIHVVHTHRRGKSIGSNSDNLLERRRQSLRTTFKPTILSKLTTLSPDYQTEIPITTYHRSYDNGFRNQQFNSVSTNAPKYLFETTTVPLTTTTADFESSEKTTTFRNFNRFAINYDESNISNRFSDDLSGEIIDDGTTTDFLKLETTTTTPTTTIPSTVTTTTTPAAEDFVTTTEITTNIPSTTINLLNRNAETPSEIPLNVFNSQSIPIITNSNSRSSNNEKPSARIAKHLDSYLSNQNQPIVVNKSNKNSDARALELLKSLYSLAGKFGKR